MRNGLEEEIPASICCCPQPLAATATATKLLFGRHGTSISARRKAPAFSTFPNAPPYLLPPWPPRNQPRARRPLARSQPPFLSCRVLSSPLLLLSARSSPRARSRCCAAGRRRARSSAYCWSRTAARVGSEVVIVVVRCAWRGEEAEAAPASGGAWGSATAGRRRSRARTRTAAATCSTTSTATSSRSPPSTSRPSAPSAAAPAASSGACLLFFMPPSICRPAPL